MLDVFPQNLEKYEKGNVATKSPLADLDGFLRLYGALIDPQIHMLTLIFLIRACFFNLRAQRAFKLGMTRSSEA